MIGLASLVVILGFKRGCPKVPGVLVAVVGATMAVGLLEVGGKYDLSVVGPLPRGLPGRRTTTP